MNAAAAEQDPAGESHAKEVTDEQVMQKLPEELRRQSLSGSLPVSLNTLRVSFGFAHMFGYTWPLHSSLTSANALNTGTNAVVQANAFTRAQSTR